ncbi:hypothetical protein SELMODRAFT_429972 [Selaginella moellendorffii]|uniref:Hedgehog protein Hint domain-containing protein n=1 Tax=Selaginella moellendorffii TaxID=88036 RepID=D8T7X6_SELML|nr:hypothetical protein SELMODRAFT_429972 [Selaginella moellendorffii]
MAHTFFFATSLFAVLASVVLATNTSSNHRLYVCKGDATVQMYNGDLKLMRDLEVGDKVAVSKNVFSDVYAFGHKDADVSSEFIQVHTASDMIELSKGHFIPVDAKGKLVYKGAKDLQVGETLWGSSEITELSKVEKLGLYNPFTLSGNIMWILEIAQQKAGELASCRKKHKEFLTGNYSSDYGWDNIAIHMRDPSRLSNSISTSHSSPLLIQP